MSPDRDHRLYVEDMLEFCNTALAYTRGFDQPGFQADRMRYDATLRNIELIGEASTHVPPEVRAMAPGGWRRRWRLRRARPASAYNCRKCRALALGTLDSAMAWSKLARQPPRCTARASK